MAAARLPILFQLDRATGSVAQLQRGPVPNIGKKEGEMKYKVSFRTFRAAGSMAAALGILATMLAAGDLARADSITYTTDADFDLGMLNGVNHDPPNNDQLQPNIPPGTTFPILWIANAGEDTVSKIDTETPSMPVPSGGCEVARYRTGFGPAGVAGAFVPFPHGAFSGPAPSRTTVDLDGNVYVANRHFDGKPAEVVKVLTDGFIDRNGNGVIDTSTDADGNCQIGPAEILPLEDSNGNGFIEDSEIQDERIAWIVQVGTAGGIGRSLCIDTAGTIWLGLFSTQEYFRLNPADGSILAGPIAANVSTYGCLVDSQGRLWSANLGTTLGELDTTIPATVATHSHAGLGFNYGIAIGEDKVYLANSSGRSYTEFDPATGTFSTPATAFVGTLGISVDAAGDIVLGQTTIFKFAPNGNVVWSSGNPQGSGSTRGVVVDANNDIWVVNLSNNNVSKFNGATGAFEGALPVGVFPYTYSDATGFAVRNITTPTGIWTVEQDSGEVGTTWGQVSWNDDIPAGAMIVVRVRAADTVAGLDLQSFVEVANGGDANLTGRFLEAQVRLTAPGPGISGPTLFDITLNFQLPNAEPVADAGPDQIVECSLPGAAEVTLNGTGSSDPDGDPLTFDWATSVGPLTGPTPTVTLPLGMETIVLTVDDGRGGSDFDAVKITVEDTTAPVVLASLTRRGDDDDDDGDDDEGRFEIGFSASDICDPAVVVTAVLVVPGIADIPVVNGQVIEFEAEDDDTEVEHEDGILEIEAPSLTLRVTATDASNNSAVAEARLPGTGGANDDDDDDNLTSAELDD